MSLDVLTLHGAQIHQHWQSLAQLRIAVFREFPYLYDGSLEYERHYLETYWNCADSIVVLLCDGDQVVGATTALPLAAESPEIRAPFARPQDYFYLGESVLLPGHRGQGYGNLFFDRREQWAHSLGFRATCFCAVERAEPPAGYHPLHDFWRKRGYVYHPELRCQMSWQDVGESVPTPKPLSFWLRES